MTLATQSLGLADVLRRFFAHGPILLAAVLLAGCATGPKANPADPLEPWNRGVYQFNDVLDRNVLKPVATAYQESVPEMLRRGVSNFFSNLGDAWTTVNSILQLKGQAAGESFTRFWVNSFFGLGGVLDVASEMQIPRHNEDLGQTLGHWGVGSGPYLVLPLLGPSTVRDTAALPADWRGDLVTHLEPGSTRTSLIVTRLVDRRARLLKQEELVDQAALDKYSFLRDSYLQYRRNLVFDGNPPEEPMIEDNPDNEPAPTK
ncbi:MAG: VacJ family lipoprotein [Curvibacter sp.]|jgi:phospholipid-binding lipoprotein MlaA|nr:VacJ family lipoprotein [Curvibacter sp.]